MGLTPVTRALFADLPSHALRELPILFALLLVAVVTNIAAVKRVAIIAAARRGQSRAAPAEPEPTSSDAVPVAPPSVAPAELP
jgi:hypothetical protein